MADEKIVTNSYPGLHQAISGESKPAEVTIETEVPPVAATPELKEGDPGYVAPQAAAPAEPVPAAKVNAEDLSDEEFEKILQKRTGKTLKELTPEVKKTAEEIAAEAKQKKSEVLAWALENKVIEKDKYDKSIVDASKSDEELALQIFTANVQAEDKDISAEEAKEMFMDTYHQVDPENRLFKIGQKEIKKLADAYRKENLIDDEDIASKYDFVVNTQNNYKAYKGQVKEVAAELPKAFEFEMTVDGDKGTKETFKYEFPVDEKILTKVLGEFSAEKEFSIRDIASDGKIDKKQISAQMQDALKARLFDTIVPELLKKHEANVKTFTLAQAKNIPDQRQLNNGRQDTSKPAAAPQARPGFRQALENAN